MVKRNISKDAVGRVILVIIILVVFMIAGLLLGGFSFSIDVLKNMIMGMAVGAMLKLILMAVTGVSKIKLNKG